MINYVDDLKQKITTDGLNDDLLEILSNDIQYLDDLGVKTNKDRNIAFYLDYFFNDICEEMGISGADKRNTIKKAFLYLSELDEKNIDLLTIRLAILKACNKKNAYPNTSGVSFENMRPVRDIDKWVEAFGNIYKLTNNGVPQNKAFSQITEDWDPMEKHDFKAWMRYYRENTHEKYKVANTSWLDDVYIPEEVPEEKIKRVKTPEDVKKSLLGRLHSAEKLLYNFVHVWPNDVYNRLHQGLSDLKREIMMMRTESSMKDLIIKTAHIWNNNGFAEGAEELRKIADTHDITQQIEKALVGDKKTQKEDFGGSDDFSLEAPEFSPETPDLSQETPGFDLEGESPDIETEKMDFSGEIDPVLEGMNEELPEPEEPPLEKEVEEISVKEEPEEDASVKDVLNILEPFLQKLREREDVRSLYKADMLLDKLNIASHFPELTEVQSKVLEANTYVSIRVEKVISKLKGGLKEDLEENDSPNIDMDELRKEVFEVSEEK